MACLGRVFAFEQKLYPTFYPTLFLRFGEPWLESLVDLEFVLVCRQPYPMGCSLQMDRPLARQNVRSWAEAACRLSAAQMRKVDVRLLAFQMPSTFQDRRYRFLDSRDPCLRPLGVNKVKQISSLATRRQRVEGAVELRVFAKCLL